MPSDILRGGNGTTDAIVTILGRLGLWEVPHLENRPSLPSMVKMTLVVKF